MDGRVVLVPLVMLMACDPTARLADPPDAPNAVGDIGTTLPNEPVEPGIDTDVVITDTEVDPVGGRSVTSLSTGDRFGCATWSDDALACWGFDEDGRADPPRSTASRVSVGFDHACAIDTDDTVFCWGDDSSGEASPPAVTFQTIAAGTAATCGLTDAGDVRCWGDLPGSPAAASPATRVAVGGSAACSITSAGVVCWGDGPVVTGVPSGVFSDLAVGQSHACAIDEDASGAIVCWGADSEGQATPPSGSFERVFAGGDATCALDDNGAIACWGSPPAGRPGTSSHRIVALGADHGCSVRGELGLVCWGDDTSFQATPPTFDDAVDVEIGDDGHACVLDAAGRLDCMGPDGLGQASPPGGTYTTFGLGANHGCGNRSSNPSGVICWGADGNEQVSGAVGGTYLHLRGARTYSCGVRSAGGDPTANTLECWSAAFTDWAAPRGDFIDLALGSFHTLALRSDGEVYTSGLARDGRLAVPDGVSFIDVAAGPDYSCGVSDLGALYCFGANVDGGPLAPPAGSDFTRVSAGADHACAIGAAGALTCWGTGGVGQLTPPSGAFDDVASGPSYSCGIRADGTVACWGSRKL